MNKKGLLLFLLAVIGFGVTNAQDRENWFVSSMANQPIGYFTESFSREENKAITKTTMKLIINRKGNKIEIHVNSKTTESAKGQFLSANAVTRTTGQDIIIDAKLLVDTVVVTMTTNGKDYTSKIGVSEMLLGPEAIRKKSLEGLKQNGDSINYALFAPEFGSIIHAKREFVARENIVANSSSQPVYKIQESFKENPFTRDIWVDEDFNLVKMLDPSPFGNVESFISTKDVASTAGENTELPAEMYEKTMSVSNVRFTDARSLEQVTFKITQINKSTRFPNLASSFQKILEQGKDYVILEYTRPALKKSSGTGKQENLMDYLSPNSLINSDDPDIIKIAKEVTRNKKTNFEKSVALKNWVSANVKGDLGVVFAPGSEVCKTRKGTCVAFSTFFASLLRAINIPAKYMGGYVYMGGVWAGHAWVEVYIDGIWIPMDATINTTDIADAARFSFGDGWSLKTGASEYLFSEGATLYGNADIKVLSYVVNGRKINVAESEKNYSVENHVYYNPGKKLVIKKPVGYEFADLNAVWPSSSFATLKTNTGEIKIVDGYWRTPDTREKAIQSEIEEISQSSIKSTIFYNGQKIYLLKDPRQAFFAITRGKELMLFYAKGDNPLMMLKQILVNTKFN